MKWLPALALGAVVVALGSSAAARARADVARPNVIVLMTADQTVESLRVMPKVQRLLVDRGASFDSSFVAFPLSGPSRASFLTGEYAHNHAVLDNAAPSGGYGKLNGRSTLPVWLQRAGYYTAHLGRYVNGYGGSNPREIPPGWNEWRGAVEKTAYRYYGYTLNENGKLVDYGKGARAYQTDVLARKAVDVIRRRARAEQPFFLSVAFLAPHAGGPRTERVEDSPLPAWRHRDRFAAEALPAPPSFNEAEVSDKPRAIRRRPLLSTRIVAEVAARYRLRLESLLAVDEAVGAIVDELRRSGELADTYLVFTSDNGFFQGEHRLPFGKSRAYEPAIRVPLVVRGPGIAPGERLSQPVANVDLAPTVLEAAGAKTSRRLDGRSLLPLLRDPGVRWGRDLLIEGARVDAPSRSYAAVRTPRYVYAEYGTGETELYDVLRDPYELSSVHERRAYERVRGDLARRLARLRDCAGKICRQGPALSASVRVQGGCPGALVTIQLRGDDAAAVLRVDFVVGARRVAGDRRAPFRVVLRLPKRPSPLRLHAFLYDGREVTKDRMLPACR